MPIVVKGNKLDDTVLYPNHNDFLFKKAKNVDKDKEGNYRVWIDDQIDWEIGINDSLSDINAGSKIVDEIKKGLIYVNNSLKIYKQDGTELDSNKYEFTEPDFEDNNGEGTTLTITFNENINERYTIKYSTVVVTKIDSIGNNASFNREEVIGTTTEDVEITVKRSSEGTGSGRAAKGSIVINKIDSDKGNPITAETEFEIYYMLNGEKRLVDDQKQKT